MTHIFIVLATKIGEVAVPDVLRHAAAREREENVVDECDWSCGAFDIEENASRWHVYPAMNERPRQTGSNFSSTALSVYQGVHPDGS